MTRISWIAAALLLAMLLGCGNAQDKAERVVPPTAEASAREALAAIASSGVIGSASMQLRTNFEELKSTDEAKGTALLTDLEALEKMADPVQIREKAAKMAAQL